MSLKGASRNPSRKVDSSKEGIAGVGGVLEVYVSSALERASEIWGGELWVLLLLEDFSEPNLSKGFLERLLESGGGVGGVLGCVCGV